MATSFLSVIGQRLGAVSAFALGDAALVSWTHKAYKASDGFLTKHKAELAVFLLWSPSPWVFLPV